MATTSAPPSRPLVFQKRTWTERVQTMEDPFEQHVQCRIHIRVMGLPPGADSNFAEYITVTDHQSEREAFRTLDDWAEQVKQRIKEQYESGQDHTDSGIYRHGQDDITS